MKIAYPRHVYMNSESKVNATMKAIGDDEEGIDSRPAPPCAGSAASATAVGLVFEPVGLEELLPDAPLEDPPVGVAVSEDDPLAWASSFVLPPLTPSPICELS